MVDRDDLLDGGASQVARTVRGLRTQAPELLVETLVGDFVGRMRDVDVVLESEPDVFAHNIEVVRRISPVIRDQRCDYDTSLKVLERAKVRNPARLVKELDHGRDRGARRGSTRVTARPPECRDRYRDARTVSASDAEARRGRSLCDRGGVRGVPAGGAEIGFAFVASGPLVRSSYHAAEGFVAARLRPGGEPGKGAERATRSSERPALDGGPMATDLISPASLVRRVSS